MNIYLATPEAATQWAEHLAKQLPRDGYISLTGPLGSGKSHFSRAVIQALGHNGHVPSPTYTLVEHYASVNAYHLDLYRLGDPEELEFLNMREAIDSDSLCLIEWAEKGRPWLPDPVLEVSFDYVDTGREVSLISPDQAWLESLSLKG